MTYEPRAGRDLYLVPASGTLSVNGARIDEGDGVAITNEASLNFEAFEESELVAVELF